MQKSSSATSADGSLSSTSTRIEAVLGETTLRHIKSQDEPAICRLPNEELDGHGCSRLHLGHAVTLFSHGINEHLMCDMHADKQSRLQDLVK